MRLDIAHDSNLSLGVVVTQVVMRWKCRSMMLGVRWCSYLCTPFSYNELLNISLWSDGEIIDEHLDAFV